MIVTKKSIEKFQNIKKPYSQFFRFIFKSLAIVHVLFCFYANSVDQIICNFTERDKIKIFRTEIFNPGALFTKLFVIDVSKIDKIYWNVFDFFITVRDPFLHLKMSKIVQKGPLQKNGHLVQENGLLTDFSYNSLISDKILNM